MSEEQPHDPSAKRERRLAKHFRWQAFFERCAEPLFVLDRRGRLLFVNRAWETLTGVGLGDAHHLVCRRFKPVASDISPEDLLAHILTPPPDVRRGGMGRVRRSLFKGDGTMHRLEVEFLPLLQEGERGGYFVVGRIRPLKEDKTPDFISISEKLIDLRQRRLERFRLDDWTSPLPNMKRLVEQARLASQVTAPVLFVGEAGTGKQTLARTIHFLGGQREEACAVLDCEHLPPAALAALLFGSRGGREHFTAMYLREPASLPRDLQLRLVDTIRGASEEESRLRVFAGCRQKPDQAVREGRLLEELACALSTLVLELPPLRERQADLPALVERLLERSCIGREMRVAGLDADAWALLRDCAWPGNVRELYHVLRSACARSTGPLLRTVDLPSTLRRAVERAKSPPNNRPGELPLEQLLEEAERRLIQLALQRAGGKKALAARLLSIPRPRLWRRMIKLGIVDTEGPDDAREDREPSEK